MTDTPMPDPLPPPPPPVPAADDLFALAASLGEDVAPQSPARRGLADGAVASAVVATSGGPVQATRLLAGEEPTPGSAVAVAPAACESTGAVVAAGAGASSGRDGKGAVERASRPVEDLGRAGESRFEESMVTAAPVSADSEGRAGVVGPPARFSLPRPPEFSIGVGPQYDALPRRWS